MFIHRKTEDKKRQDKRRQEKKRNEYLNMYITIISGRLVLTQGFGSDSYD